MNPGSRAPTLLAGPLGEDLRGRLLRACAQAQQLLGWPAEPERAVDPERLRDLITGLSGRLPDAPGGGQRAQEHAAALQRLDNRFRARFDALAHAHSAVPHLREITAPAAMLARAPSALCGASRFERAILSRVGGGRMIAEAAYFQDEEAAAARVLAELRSSVIRLEHPLIETELLRRRRATIVVDARVHPRVNRRLGELMNWSSYAAAPLIAGAQVIGVLHADRGPEGRVDVLDRDVLWEFASTLGQAYESASLLRALRHERDQVRQFLEWLGSRSRELTDAPIRLATVQRLPRGLLSPPPPTPLRGTDDRAVFEGLLTRRELEVLRLLADGSTNREIAEALVISDGTVKFHVNRILRKLRVANRSEAVARYLRLLGPRGW